MAVNIGPKIGVDGEAEYRRQINQIIQQSKTLESQMKLVASSFTSATSAEEKSAKTSAVLTKQIEVQRDRVKLLAEQTGKTAAKYGEADIRTQKYQEQLNKAQTALNSMRRELRETTQGVEGLSNSEEKGSKKTKDFAGSIKDDFSSAANKGAGGALTFGKAIKAHIIAAGIIAGVKALAAAMKKVVEVTVDLGKQSIMGFAEQEQLIGGVDTLFKESSAQVQQYANEAYKTAGLSANQYMETVTSFSASLLQSMGGDTQAAAEKANRAITDMSDNANKMGTDMTSIQNAYQGFAKQNYTMLDNLKLGYGGTKQEMERLVAEAAAMTEEQEKLNVAVNAGDLSFSNIVGAISVVQEHLDIAGTTADEAATTIQGSANAMKSAWRNLITGMSNENLDLDKLVQNAIDSVNIFADNLTTRLQIMLPRFAEGLNKLVTGLIPYVGPALELLLPSLVQGIGGLVSGIVQALPAAVEAITAVIPMLVEQLTLLLPQIISAGVEIIAALASGIGENLPTLIPAVVDAIITITEGLLDHIDLLIIAAGQLIAGLAQGLIEAIPRLIGRLPEIIGAIVKGLLKGLAAIGAVGQELVEGLFNGISNAATWLYEKVKGWASSVVGWIKDFFGIHSPSKVFADEVGKFIPPGITLGVEQAMPRAMRAMGDELAALTDIPLPGAGSTTTTNMGGVVLNVYGAEGQDVNALADAVMYRLQSAVERREAVFA